MGLETKENGHIIPVDDNKQDEWVTNIDCGLETKENEHIIPVDDNKQDEWVTNIDCGLETKENEHIIPVDDNKQDEGIRETHPDQVSDTDIDGDNERNVVITSCCLRGSPISGTSYDGLRPTSDYSPLREYTYEAAAVAIVSSEVRVDRFVRSDDESESSLYLRYDPYLNEIGRDRRDSDSATPIRTESLSSGVLETPRLHGVRPWSSSPLQWRISDREQWTPNWRIRPFNSRLIDG